MIYSLSRAFYRLALPAFFREARIIDADRLPAAGAVLAVSNHSNALVDPLFVMAYAPRRITMTAKSALRRSPFLRLILRAWRVIQFNRVDDGASLSALRDNVRALEKCLAVLRRGGFVYIFPEGKSHSEREMLPFKQGAAKLALDYLRDGSTGGPLQILPLGLSYSAKSRFRSRVEIRVGLPIDAAEWRRTNPEAGPEGLTARLRAEVAALTAAPAGSAPKPNAEWRCPSALKHVEVLLAGLPLAAVGLLCHAAPALIVHAGARILSREEDQWASNTLYPALAVFPLYYLALLCSAAALLPPFWFAAFAASLPLTACYLLQYLDRLADVRTDS